MQRRAGFTLVELSIVLVILGLLVGGVLSGQSLIRAAELRSVLSDRDKYMTALNAFKDKYFALPGDMANAFQFWGTACGTDTTTASTGCNGDGNGLVVAINAETIKVWEHLSRAGLIEGNFDGTGTISGGNGVEPSKTNVPASKIAQNYWMIGERPCDTCGLGENNADSWDNAHVLLAMGTLPTLSGWTFLNTSTLTNGEMWNLDKKTDDGRSMRGRMRGVNQYGCEDTAADPYNIASEGQDARMCNPTYLIK